MSKMIWKSGWLSGVLDELVITETIHNNKKEYVLINTRGDFGNSHTHVKNFKDAKMMATLVAKKLTPKSKSSYFIESLIRVNKSKKYGITLQKHLMEINKYKNKL